MGQGMGQKGGLPVSPSLVAVPVLSNPASTQLPAHSIFLQPTPESLTTPISPALV